MTSNIAANNQPTANHFVYIQKLAQPLGDVTRPTAYARFYTGEAQDVEVRTDEHMRGVGSKMLAYAVEQGIAFEVELIIGCDSAATAKVLEKLIKSRGGVERQLPSLRKLAQSVVTMEILKGRGRKDPHAVVEARQQRLNKRAQQRREDAAFDAAIGGSAEIVYGGARPIYEEPIYTPGVPAYLWADQPCADYDLAY